LSSEIIDYALNKFLPFGIIGFLLLYNFGYETWEPFVIFGLTMFIDRFSFKTGYAVCFCEQNGIEIDFDERK